MSAKFNPPYLHYMKAKILINLSVVNMEPCVASVALIGLFNEGCGAHIHEGRRTVKSLRVLNNTASNPLYSHTQVWFCTLSVLDNNPPPHGV